jgi:hypothetical protein
MFGNKFPDILIFDICITDSDIRQQHWRRRRIILCVQASFRGIGLSHGEQDCPVPDWIVLWRTGLFHDEESCPMAGTCPMADRTVS